MVDVTLYSHGMGPNGWKVAMTLKALGISYETKYLDFASKEQKSVEHTQHNPNGRIPTIVDHKNGDFALWESDAIMQYLVDTYDTKNILSSADPKERAQILQYLFFQSSGQGAYFGQAAHFIWFQTSKDDQTYGKTRYAAEVKRVCEVLEGILSKQAFLVGSHVTVADIAFVPWNVIALDNFFPEGTTKADFPALMKWHNSLCELPYVKASLAERDALMAAPKA